MTTPGPRTPDPELFTLAEAAEVARMSRRTLEALIAQGAGPATVRISRRIVRVRRADLIAWIDAHREGGDAA